MIIILALAFILRLVNINQSLWLDEAISAVAANKFSYFGLIADFTKFDFHPPLFYMILKFWGGLFGYGETALRMLPVIFGISIIYIVYLIGKELGLKARLVALLLATSPLHVYYSQEVRMYPLVAFFVALSFLAFYKLLKKSSLSFWVVFSLSIVCFMALDYVPVFLLPSYWVIARYLKKDRKFFAKMLIAFFPLLLLFAFWLPTLAGQIASGKELATSLPLWAKIVGSPSFKELALVWVKFVVGRITFYNKILYSVLILVLSAFYGYSFINGLRAEKKGLVFWLLTPLCIGFLFSFFVPAFSYFRFLYLLPVFYLIITSGVGSRLMMITLIGINLLCLGFYFINQNNWREDWKGAVGFVESKAKSDDVVLFEFNEPFATWEWYSTKKVEAVGARNKSSEKIVAGKSGVWYFEYLADVTDPDRKLINDLYSMNYKRTADYSFRGVGKITYLRKQAP